MRSQRTILLALGFSAALASGCGGSGGGGGTPGSSGAPTISVGVAATPPPFAQFTELSFPVTATDLEGDAVTLTLSNPPDGAEFAPVTGVGSATGTFRWDIDFVTDYEPSLRFRATDDAGNVTTLAHPLRLQGRLQSTVPFRCCDVTGDGVLDVIAPAREADVGAVDSGALYVFAGAETPGAAPTAVLSVAGAGAEDDLGASYVCSDVTGDGVLDVVAAAPTADAGAVEAGAVYVFAGGPTLVGSVAPHATLTVPGASAGDVLGNNGIRCSDVTGDTTPDVIAWSEDVDLGVADAGAVYVWGGGAGLVRTVAPTASLQRTTPAGRDKVSNGGVLCCDVSGDGRDDLIVISTLASVGGMARAGSVDVWFGGPDLTGTRTPGASLEIPNASASDGLGRSGVRCCDVTGDSTLDIVAGSQRVDLPGAANAGAVYVWAGGNLAGTPPPAATLTRKAPVTEDLAGLFQCGDVTGDGRLDVIWRAPFADVGLGVDVGEVLVWAGGSLAGTPPASATLRIDAPTDGDRLGEFLRCCDVTGDGTDDLIVEAHLYDGTVVNEGAVFVWTGGAAMARGTPPRAHLERAAPVADDQLGQGFRSLQCCDVTGDGIRDVIVGTSLVDAGTIVDAGGAFVYAGRSAFAGVQRPTASLLRPSPAPNDQLLDSSSRLLRCCDVTGDGVRDVLVAGDRADIGSADDAGIVLVWQGGTNLAGAPLPTATLQASHPISDDRMSLHGYACCDLDGDGIQDVVVPASLGDLGPTSNAGAVFFWRGGPRLAGTAAPVVMQRAAPEAGDLYSNFDPPLCCDITGDGQADFLTAAPQADIGGIANVGVLGFWRGGAVPTPTPTVELAVPGATAGDRLGEN